MSGRPAILGGTPIRAGKAWPSWPQWDGEESELLREVLESGRWSSSGGGRLAAEWADEFAVFHGARYGLAVTNGTQAIEAALAASGVGDGDEVIVPALTFVATASAALAVNARPVIVDVDPLTLCIDVDAVEAAIGEQTRAVVPVHLAGVAADMDALMALCRRHGLALVEDAAHAHGSRWRGRGLGSLGDFGSFSFQAHKLITAGEGGALITDDEQRRATAWSYINCGHVDDQRSWHHASYGSNMRMSEWQAAILRAQLRRFPAQHRRRAERAAQLDAALIGLEGIRPQHADERMDSRARYAYVFDYDAAAFSGLEPQSFRDALTAEGIPAAAYHRPVHTLSLFREARFAPRLRAGAPSIDYSSLRLPHAEAAARSTVWLGHHMLLAEPEDVLDIVRAIERIRQHARAIAQLNSARALFARAGQRLRQPRSR